MAEDEGVADEAPKRAKISDPLVMRALAHPARLTILEELALGRAGTATEFAAVCGLTPSATSYHLRALARAGLVQEAPGRGDGRERVWQLVVSGGYEVEIRPGSDAETIKAEQELVLIWLARSEARVRNWVVRWPDEPREWYEAASLSETMIVATVDELRDLNRKVAALLQPYALSHRAEPPPESRMLAIGYRTVPLPDKPDKSGH
ncbi:ArsR/SmtB family transcription factor [Virgisporangium aurantiacum]|uniref:ArsR/SmtB family transcription factor n=1 Tax=Virgisporangium aurantiacum TaxID=175570 RepID=UPI001EF3CE52|nr:metalloregulator ArsR/SmtB family transcription factor [Virgisporangium aurantiacum]